MTLTVDMDELNMLELALRTYALTIDSAKSEGAGRRLPALEREHKLACNVLQRVLREVGRDDETDFDIDSWGELD